MYWAIESQWPRNTQKFAQESLQEKGITLVMVNMSWAWWKRNNDDIPSMQSTEKMNSTSNLE